MISSADKLHLMVVQDKPFQPIGWLHESVYEGLRERGLVSRGLNGYYITELGKKEMESE